VASVSCQRGSGCSGSADGGLGRSVELFLDHLYGVKGWPPLEEPLGQLSNMNFSNTSAKITNSSA